jgi:hypothetical protein
MLHALPMSSFLTCLFCLYLAKCTNREAYNYGDENSEEAGDFNNLFLFIYLTTLSKARIIIVSTNMVII